MSAYVLGQDEVCEAAVFLKNVSDAFPERMDALARALYRLNISAVNQRYSEDDTADDFTFTFKAVPERVQGFKLLKCLRYQCSEGDVFEHELYKRLNETVETLALEISEGSEAYDRATWGGTPEHVEPKEPRRVRSDNPTAVIRAELKRAHGWTSRQVSVRLDSYSMGSSIRIRIKDARIPISIVKAIAEEHEHIDRDQWGEILSGGNRFVFVDYSSEAETATAALAAIPEGSNEGRVVGDSGFIVGRVNGSPWRGILWARDGSHTGEFDARHGHEHAAYRIGVLEIERAFAAVHA